MSRPREISHSEARSLVECQAKHAFQYTGRLSDGWTFSKRVPAEPLRYGTIWGEALASYYAKGPVAAMEALEAALKYDATRLKAAKAYSHEQYLNAQMHLGSVLQHHMKEGPEPLSLREPEKHLLVPMVVKGKDFAFRAYLDGLADDPTGVWIAEFKLRMSALTDRRTLVLDRQFRRYAWAARELLDIEPVGIIVEERISGFPGPVVLNKDGTPRKGQAQCSPADYLAACEAAGAEPDEPTVEKLSAKRWYQREHILFTPGELDEVGRELESVALMVDALDHGRLYPIRAANKGVCPRCDFRDICPDPEGSGDYIASEFWRNPPKREREHKRDDAPEAETPQEAPVPEPLPLPGT